MTELNPTKFYKDSVLIIMADNSLTKPPTLPLHEQTLHTAISRGDMRRVTANTLAIVGFPYSRMSSSFEAPTMFRDFLEYYKFGPIYNMEYDQDLSKINFLDLGDIVTESEEWVDEMSLTSQLASTVAHCKAKRATTFVIGGSHDLIAHGSTEGSLHSASGQSIVHIIVGSRMGKNLFYDLVRQYHQQQAGNLQTPPMKIVLFGAQPNQCDATEMHFLSSIGAEIYWMHKDIRAGSMESVSSQFLALLSRIDATYGEHVDILVTMDTACIAAPLFFLPTTYAPEYLLNPQGFRVGELLELALISGANPKVSLVNITQHTPCLATTSPTSSFGLTTNMEDNSPYQAIIPELFYHFAIGLASRETVSSSSSSQPTNSSVPTF